MAGPAAVLVLNPLQVFRHLLVPLLPFFAALGQERLTDVHVTQELLAAVGAEASDELLVVQLVNQSFNRGFVGLFDLSEVIQIFLRLCLVILIGFGVGEDAFGFALAGKVGVDGFLQGVAFGGAVVDANARISWRSRAARRRS